jgi:thioredoxin-dependent peroxiredoxin
LRDRADDFAAANCVVLGASFDTVADNAAFARQQHFGFPLLSDADRTVGAAYEVVRPVGHKYREFPERISYLIDGIGVIRVGYEVADVAGHADVVLADLARLKETDV